MSVYNGSRFLKEQLQSIEKQEDVHVSLLIRDDGSTDNSASICQSFAEKASIPVEIICGTNVGWRKSFFELLSVAHQRSGYAYFGFSDQDDVWMPKKIAHAVETLKTENKKLYCSNLSMVDESKHFVAMRYPEGYSPSEDRFKRFFSGVGTGSTLVFSDEFMQQLVIPNKSESLAHDAYLVAIANLTNAATYDSNSYISYRRYTGNATGFDNHSNQFKPRLTAVWHRYLKAPRRVYSERARTLLLYQKESFDPETIAFLKVVASANDHRIRSILSRNMLGENTVQSMKIKFRILVGNV